jgi:hypothetical protein
MALSGKEPSWFISGVVKPSLEENAPSWFIEGVVRPNKPEGAVDEELEKDLVERQEPINRARSDSDFQSTMLKKIQSHEAPRFGYDSWYGRGTSRGPVAPPKPPTQMTINEVLEWQNTHNPPGPETTAVGAYQFVDQPNARTLSGVAKEMGLKGDELFTPELQDRMAIHLLKRRGLDDFLAGKLPVERFANNVAKEWASLPVLTDTKRGRIPIRRGQSYYANDGINGTTVKDLEEYEEIFSLADINGDIS